MLNTDLDSLAFADPEVVTLAGDARRVVLPGVGGRLYWQVPEVYAEEVAGFVLAPPAEAADDGGGAPGDGDPRLGG